MLVNFFLVERRVAVPFAGLLSIPHVNLIMSLENKRVWC